MTNKFLKSISEKQFKEDLKASVIFSQTVGLIIILLSGYKFLVSSNIKLDNYYIILMLIGLVIFSLGLIYPYIFFKPLKILNKITNLIINLLCTIIFLILYIIFIIPIGIIFKIKNKQKYLFIKWNNEYNNINSSYQKVKDIKIDTKRNSRLINSLNIINYFIKNKNYLLLPVLLIIIIIGLLFFFLTSSIITPLIYPLFG